MRQSLINFYEGKSQNIYGKTFNDIINFDFKTMEKNHHYIQYLFPSFEKSSWNLLAPTLDDETVSYFKESIVIKENIKKAFLKMLEFYGFKYEKINDYFKCVVQNKEKLSFWITPNNHNFKRISRILNFLRIMEFTEEADAFYAALYNLSLEYSVLEEALIYWTQANED